MSCVCCHRPKQVETLISKEEGNPFLCWYCRAQRLASATAMLLESIGTDKENDCVELAKRELGAFPYSARSVGQMTKEDRILEESK